MNVARLNFSHGDFAGHGEVIKKIRAAAEKTGRRAAIMADLPGPKMRIGTLSEPVTIHRLTFYPDHGRNNRWQGQGVLEYERAARRSEKR